MPFSSIHAAARFSRTLFAIAVAIALGLAAAACGGGGDDASEALTASSAHSKSAASAQSAAQQAAAPVFVAVEGCVLDRFYGPTTGTPVRALAADGRLLGNARSDGQGRFTLRLPLRSEVTLQIDRLRDDALAAGDAVFTRLEAVPKALAPCLVDELA